MELKVNHYLVKPKIEPLKPKIEPLLHFFVRVKKDEEEELAISTHEFADEEIAAFCDRFNIDGVKCIRL